MSPITAIGDGPNSIAPRAIPVGCEQLPVRDGIFSADSMNTNAPAIASSIFALGTSSIFVFMALNPNSTKGAEIANHSTIHIGEGRNPSAMCIALEYTVFIPRSAITLSKIFPVLCFFILSPSLSKISV